MISSNNADLIHRDPAIVGLKIILDPEVFLAVLRHNLGGMRIENLQMTYIRYKPGTRCLVNYHINSGETNLNMYAIAHGYDRAIKIHNARNRRTVNRYGIPGRIILQDQGIVISVFPNDSRLALGFLGADIKEQNEFSSKLLPDRPELWDGTFLTLNYKPERRFVASLQTKSGHNAVVRFYDDHYYHRSKSVTKAFHSSTHLRIPKRIGSSNYHRALVFEWLNGQVLSNVVLGDYDLGVRTMYNTGVALAEFHLQKVDQILTHHVETEKAENLFTLADFIKFLLPHLSARSFKLAHHLACNLSFESERRKPIHGDFYPEQILVSSDRQVAFIDLDEARIDDPRIDIGEFIAHLKYMVLSGRLPEIRLPLLTEAFLHGYQQTAGKDHLCNLYLYVAAGLFRLLPNPFRYCETDWGRHTEQILNIAESEISKSRSYETNHTPNRLLPDTYTKVPVIDHYDIRQDKKMPFLIRALNPQEVEPLLIDILSHHLGKNVEQRLLRINVLRYKPNRRCLVEYEIGIKGKDYNPNDVFVTLLGKARSKGPDFKTYNLVRDLWDSDFDSNSTDFISVPQPIGIIPELHMWFHKKVQGIPVIDLLITGSHESLNLARRIAEAIYKVHQRGSNPNNSEHKISDELRILDERLCKVAEENPSWKARIRRLLDGCHSLARQVPNPKTTNIHRDFYHDQVIIEGHHLYITDFDVYCKGDPALDVGNFKAHLEEYALRKNNDVCSLSNVEEAFVQRFLELSGKSKKFSIEAYTMFALARHISISMQFPSRRHLTEALISLCERRLDLLLDQKKGNIDQMIDYFYHKTEHKRSI